MKRLNNSNFELIQDVIKEMTFNYNPDEFEKTEQLKDFWEEIIGNKISKFSKVYNFSDDNIITISCADSFVANELYYEKEKLLKLMNEKAEKLGIIIKEIKFDYKKWKESNNEEKI